RKNSQSDNADSGCRSCLHRRISLLLSLDLNMFGLALPAQRSALNHFSDFVHDNNHDHENDDAHENIGSLEYARRHTDEKTHTLGSGDEFSDDGADDREGNARADAS